MRVLVIHNAYQQRGGEDAVVANEAAALRRKGCEVETFLVSNDEISSPRAKLGAWMQVVDGGRQVDAALARARSFRPHVAHVHNYFPLLSPSIHGALRGLGVPTVQTFHNFRFACASALLFRNGAVCRTCLKSSPYRAVLHACYRGSRLGSLAVARSIAHHRRADTWSTQADRIIALTDFARQVMIEAGLPAGKIVVKPNGLRDPGAPRKLDRGGMLYVGRLSEEKGVSVLAEAARMSQIPVTVIGDGPLASLVRNNEYLDLRGWLSPEQVRDEMAKATALVMPSLWYEGLPMTLVEAFSTATPVIASRIGSLESLVTHGRNGLHVPPGDPAALADAMAQLASDTEASARMGVSARRKYERCWTEEATTDALLAVYAQASAAAANPEFPKWPAFDQVTEGGLSG